MNIIVSSVSATSNPTLPRLTMDSTKPATPSSCCFTTLRRAKSSTGFSIIEALVEHIEMYSGESFEVLGGSSDPVERAQDLAAMRSDWERIGRALDQKSARLLVGQLPDARRLIAILLLDS